MPERAEDNLGCQARVARVESGSPAGEYLRCPRTAFHAAQHIEGEPARG